MAPREFSDETLMAYADGALDAETARAVAAAEAQDAAVARRIALFRDTGALLAQAGAARATAPVPDALMARLRETLESAAPVVSLAPKRPRPGWVPMAAAASLALAVGLAAGLALRSGPGAETAAPTLAALEASGVADALSRLEAGASVTVAAGDLSVIASFRTQDGAFCREFELASADATTVGVACAQGPAWALRFAVATGAPDEESYVPAGALEALDAWLAGIGAGAPLGGQAERDALNALPD